MSIKVDDLIISCTTCKRDYSVSTALKQKRCSCGTRFNIYNKKEADIE